MSADDALDPARLESQDFELVRRGFDPTTVREALQAAAREIRRLNLEREELSGRLAELDTVETGQIEAHRVAEALGSEATKVLEAAHTAATERAERAEREAEAVRNAARTEADTARKEAQDAADKTRADALAAKDEMIEEARREAETIVEEGRVRGREMVTEAQTVRERMLRDLARKRQTGRAQVEQLRAGRDRLLESLSTAQDSLQVAVDDLVSSVPEARAAAERAGLRVTSEPVPTADDLEGEIESARAVGHPLVDDMPDSAALDSDPFSTDELEAINPLDVLDDEREAEKSAGDGDREGDHEAEQDDGSGPEEVVEDPPEGAVEAPASDQPEAAAPPVSDEASADDGAVLYDVEAEDAEPHDVSDAEQEAEADDAEGEAAAETDDAGDALFARLRAGQPDSGSAAEKVLGAADEAAAAVAEAEEADSAERDGAHDAADDDADDAEPAVDERAQAIDDAAETAAKAMKKVLVEEQGTLLDGIRRSGGDAVHVVVDDVAAHEKPYDKAASPALKELASALGANKRLDVKPALAHVHAIALEPVRQRLAEVAARLEDPDELSDTVRALYRESRSRRIPEAAAAAATAVDGLVVIATTEGKVRWVVEEGGPCGPDCADNALAGALDPGDEFPTGDRHPPAHPTCRCRLVPADGDD